MARILLAGCVGIMREHFGTTAGGEAVELFTLRNARGMTARIAAFGGVLIELTAPDRAGRYADVVLGYDTLGGYERDSAYLGALIGRYANRIANARFTLNGVAYRLAANDGANSLHGGRRGFDKQLWRVLRAGVLPTGVELALRYVSVHGEEGYPGTLTVDAVYRLTDDDALELSFTAHSDRDTIVSLTQHAYFDLSAARDVRDHVLQIDAECFTPIGPGLIPTGELRTVAGTPFDFRVPVRIGERIQSRDPQLELARGYDHNWSVDAHAGELAVQAIVHEPCTGRVLEVASTAPGMQFYSGNLLDGSAIGKRSARYGRHAGFCLEPQHFPDAPNQPTFPSPVLRAGERYEHTIVYRFSVR